MKMGIGTTTRCLVPYGTAALYCKLTGNSANLPGNVEDHSGIVLAIQGMAEIAHKVRCWLP
jgi:hypothetical protein